MSKLTHIEQALVALSPTNFQKLGDAYLARLRGWRIQSWGTMIGADKDRTGVPDAWCQLPDDRFIFLAYTTADKDLPAKLQKDLDDCINRTQRVITPMQVERICLVFNRRCSPETAAILNQHAKIAGYSLELISIDELARDILQDPALAMDIIGLDLGSGQLVHADDFIRIHQRQIGSTPFAEALCGRDSEQAELRTKLANTDLILVTGPAGVGKTQLVLSVAQAYCAEQPTQRQLYFVFDKKSPDFIHELHLVLRPGQQIVVVADDANRVSPYFSVLLAEQLARPAGTLKVIATVRDYACESVRTAASNNRHAEMAILPLSDDAIKELIAAEPYCIRNGDYVGRIQQLSDGRPRLAIMAAKAAREAEHFYRLHNVLDIYESYFGPALDELSANSNPLLGQVLALIHFFRVVHQTDEELIGHIETAFGITGKQLWNSIQVLHDAELVEMHEGRIAKSADQILGNYVFYKIFLSERPQLAYGQLLGYFFPNYGSRVIDTLNSCIKDFNLEAIESRIQPAIEGWLAHSELSEEDRWAFYHVFWPFLTPQIIAEATHLLALKPWPTFEAANYPIPERNNHSYFREAPLFEVLKDLCSHPIEELPTALRLLIEFVAKNPDHFPKALEFLQSIAHFDYHYRQYGHLHVQETVVKVLRIGANSVVHAPFYHWLIAHVVSSCLATVFQGTRSSHKAGSILISNDELPHPTDYLKGWRESLWSLLFGLYPRNVDLVIKGIIAYQGGTHNGESSSQWLHWDADRLIPFLDKNLDPSNFAHCYLVQQYIDWYYWYRKVIPRTDFAALRRKFHSPLYRLYDLRVYNKPYKSYSERTTMRFYEPDQRDAHIRNRTKPLQRKNFSSYALLIDQLHTLAKLMLKLCSRHKEHTQLPDSIAEILRELVERDLSLGKRVVSYLLSTGNPIGLTPFNAIRALAQLDAEANYHLISQLDYQSKASWQLLFLKHLPAAQVSQQWLHELLRVFEAKPEGFNVYGLEHFQSHSTSLYPDLLSIALDVAEQDSTVQLPYGVIDKFSQFFAIEQWSLLRRYYKWWNERDSYFDWDSEDLSTIAKRQPDFLLEVLELENSPSGYSRYEKRGLKFLWQDNTFEPLILDVLIQHAQKESWYPRDGVVKSLFPKSADEEQRERMLKFIRNTIKSRPENHQLVRKLFDAVRRSLPDELMPTLELIFETFPDNPDHLFEKLSFFPSSRTTGRSWIPIYQADVQIWEQVIRTIDKQPTQTFALLDYRQYVLRQIGYLNKQIAEEAARNFADPY